MATDLLVDLGEEYTVKNGLDAITVDVGLYLDDPNNGGDDLGEGSDVGAITTEPSNGNYARVSVGLTAYDNSNANWAVDNDSLISFDFSDQTSTQDVDAAFVVYAFTASDTSDSTAQDHLIANPALSQTRDIGSIDTLEIAAGDLEIALD